MEPVGMGMIKYVKYRVETRFLEMGMIKYGVAVCR